MPTSSQRALGIVGAPKEKLRDTVASPVEKVKECLWSFGEKLRICREIKMFRVVVKIS